MTRHAAFGQVLENAGKVEATAARRRSEAWENWATDAVGNDGGKKTYRWIKETPCWKN